jgi:hypothetical protein
MWPEKGYTKPPQYFSLQIQYSNVTRRHPVREHSYPGLLQWHGTHSTLFSSDTLAFIFGMGQIEH